MSGPFRKYTMVSGPFRNPRHLFVSLKVYMIMIYVHQAGENKEVFISFFLSFVLVGWFVVWFVCLFVCLSCFFFF